ncbi:MAG: flippase-like domain-containing protein [Deltaproteobacteria bacterium]|nr:flippase-like domain-containing protein [Deltaproteobacteria bacterium]
MAFLKKTVPWLIVLATFYYLFKKYPLDQVIQAARHINFSLFISYSITYFVFMWIVDCWSLARLFSRFGSSTLVREVMPVRLATYLIMVLNYSAAQGVFAYFFKRAKQVSFSKSSSLILFITIIDLYWTITLAFIGSCLASPLVQGHQLSYLISIIWSAATAGLISLNFFWKLPAHWKLMQWLQKRELFHAFHQANIKDYLFTMITRLPMHLAVNTIFYFVAFSFGAHLPFVKVIMYLPIIILIGALPITPGGLGTTQLAAVEFFQNDIQGKIIDQGLVTPAELLLAMSLAFVFFNYFLKALSGSFFLKKATNYAKS